MIYADFIAKKSQVGSMGGFEPVWMPDCLYDFQAFLTDWAIRMGRAAIYADCGLGKSPMQLVWAENVARHTNGNVLILAPLAVSHQMVTEGEKFGVDVRRSFDDGRFVLPELQRHDHIVTPRTAPPGYLFTVPAFGLNQERSERRRTLDERTELVCDLTKGSDSAVVWCHLNPEGDRLAKEIPGAVQVKGTQSMDEKEELILSFLKGESRVLVTKAKIAGLGLNMQHCAHVVTFVDHSYEKFYQSVRRCWRFGQKRPVRLDVIATEGEINVKANMERKEQLATQMFDSIIAFMNQAQAVNVGHSTITPEVPTWLHAIKS